MSLITLIVALLVFYLTTNYAFNPYFLWLIAFNPYDGLYYLFYINYNILFLGEFVIKALLFTIILSATTLISIRISQSLTRATLKKYEEETKNSGIIRRWRANKKFTSIALILQYLTLIALIALVFLLWYNMLQQYTMTFLTLARFTLMVVSALGILYLVHPTLDDVETLTQSCLNIINSIKKGYGREDVEKIEQAHFMLYILLNHTLSRSIEELEEFNLEPPLTTLYLALLQDEKETLNKAKKITVNLLRAIREQRVQEILKHLGEIDDQLGKIQKISESMEVKLGFPSLSLYPFTPSRRITRLKAIIPLVAEILLAIVIFLGKWLYYTTFQL
ncbi:MAG: hypothetical protein ACETWM_00460 [Candidatus Lokiarchaeia archaeon]